MESEHTIKEPYSVEPRLLVVYPTLNRKAQSLQEKEFTQTARRAPTFGPLRRVSEP